LLVDPEPLTRGPPGLASFSQSPVEKPDPEVWCVASPLSAAFGQAHRLNSLALEKQIHHTFVEFEHKCMYQCRWHPIMQQRITYNAMEHAVEGSSSIQFHDEARFPCSVFSSHCISNEF
jgi:hypothetical protein